MEHCQRYFLSCDSPVYKFEFIDNGSYDYNYVNDKIPLNNNTMCAHVQYTHSEKAYIIKYFSGY